MYLRKELRIAFRSTYEDDSRVLIDLDPLDLAWVAQSARHDGEAAWLPTRQ